MREQGLPGTSIGHANAAMVKKYKRAVLGMMQVRYGRIGKVIGTLRRTLAFTELEKHGKASVVWGCAPHATQHTAGLDCCRVGAGSRVGL